MINTNAFLILVSIALVMGCSKNKPLQEVIETNASVSLPTPGLSTPAQQAATNSASAPIPAVSASVSLTANRTNDSVEINSGESVTLRWESNHADQCVLKTAAGNVLSLQRANAEIGLSLGPIDIETLVSLTCQNATSSASDSVLIRVAEAVVIAPIPTVTPGASPTATPVVVLPPPFSVNLTVNDQEGPLALPYESIVSIKWSSLNADSCRIDINGIALSTSRNETVGILSAPLQSFSRITAACRSALGGVATDTIEVSIAAPTDHVIFISSSIHQGNMGGLAGADDICQNLATAANLRRQRPWKAMISSSDVNVQDHALPSGVVKNVLGDVIVSNGANIYRTVTEGFQFNAYVRYTETGTAHTPASSGGWDIWTGSQGGRTARDGRYANPMTCRSWTSSSGVDGTVVNHSLWSPTNTIDYSTSYYAGSGCSAWRRLYCLSF